MLLDSVACSKGGASGGGGPRGSNTLYSNFKICLNVKIYQITPKNAHKNK